MRSEERKFVSPGREPVSLPRKGFENLNLLGLVHAGAANMAQARHRRGNETHREAIMEFIAQKSELLDELELIQGAVEKKSTIPILSHFLVEAAGPGLHITGSDLELAARSSCIAKVKAEGKAAVPARRLVEIIRSLPGGGIRFKGLETTGYNSPASGPRSSWRAWQRTISLPCPNCLNPRSRCRPTCSPD